MAYATNNPPVLLASRYDGGPGSLWSYISADDPATISGSGYFSNATNVGLKVGDVILCSETDNAYTPVLATVSAVTSGAATVSLNGGALATEAGAGITAGVGTIYEAGVEQIGGFKRTTIVLDLTGLNGGGTAADIIGVDAAANCHIGQITAARNGAVFMGRMTCLEVPTGSNADVDLYAASVATGVEDTAVTSLSGQAILLNGGTWTLGLSGVLTAFPAANSYLYLASGTATAATFTAGKFIIELWGV